MRALLFSGGLDSTALAWTLRPERLLFVDYGQRPAKGEERACRSIASELGARLDVRRVDLTSFGNGTMSPGGVTLSSEAPEFWPYRNQMLVTLAAMAYAAEPLEEILIGTVVTDAAHPDGRPAFLHAIDAVVRVQSGVRVVAPAADITSEELLGKASVPRSLLGWTFSCHTGEWACGACRGCGKHHDVLARVESGT